MIHVRPWNELEVRTIQQLVPARPFLVLAEVALESVMTTGPTLFQGPLQLPSCNITIPILHMRKLRPRVNQGHTAAEVGDLNLDLSDASAFLSEPENLCDI